MSHTPELSIIIPALNEAKSLPLLINDLLRQQKIIFELIIVDGGSNDGTGDLVTSLEHPEKIGIKLLRTSAGRGLQMNEGAKMASAPDLLFLHADSRVDNDEFLFDAMTFMHQQREESGLEDVAGHFSLKFIRSDEKNNGAYYFYESKARLNRKDCINGDQGIWLSRPFFNRLGMYDESLTYMEDVRLANKIFEAGCWVSLPGTLQTSARRFEREGFSERQTLNALISNFEEIGQQHFLQSAKNIYQTQTSTTKIILKPFFRAANQTLFLNGFVRGMVNWYRTGRYVAQNAWQLAFAVDCARNRKSELMPGKGQHDWLHNYDRWINLFITSPVGNSITALVTAVWFYGSWLFFKGSTDS